LQFGKAFKAGRNQAETVAVMTPAEPGQSLVEVFYPNALGYLVAAQLAVVDFFPCQPIMRRAVLQLANPLAHQVEMDGQIGAAGLFQLQRQRKGRFLAEPGMQQHALIP